jgi:hypothetical protein
MRTSGFLVPIVCKKDDDLLGKLILEKQEPINDNGLTDGSDRIHSKFSAIVFLQVIAFQPIQR